MVGREVKKYFGNIKVKKKKRKYYFKYKGITYCLYKKGAAWILKAGVVYCNIASTLKSCVNYLWREENEI